MGFETAVNRALISMWVEVDFSMAGLLVVWGCWDLEFSLLNQISSENQVLLIEDIEYPWPVIDFI